MATITFDTLKFVNRLEKAGLTREQATAIVEAQKESLSEVLDTTLATKGDIHGVRLDMAGIKTEMAGLRGEMANIKWLLGVIVALAVANFAKQFF
jgi:hypothetical protein